MKCRDLAPAVFTVQRPSVKVCDDLSNLPLPLVHDSSSLTWELRAPQSREESHPGNGPAVSEAGVSPSLSWTWLLDQEPRLQGPLATDNRVSPLARMNTTV